MEQNIFNGSDGLAIYQVISFIIFMLIFIGVIIWVFTMDKGLIKKMGEIPLEDDSDGKILFDNTSHHKGEKI